MFGRISRIRFDANGRGLGLIEFDDYFEFPSELFNLMANPEIAVVYSGVRTSRLRISLWDQRPMRRDSSLQDRCSGVRFQGRYASQGVRICPTGRKRRWIIGRWRRE